MTVPPWTLDPEKVRPVFRQMRELKERCEQLLTMPRNPTPLGADFVKVMRQDIETWTAIAKQFNIVQG